MRGKQSKASEAINQVFLTLMILVISGIGLTAIITSATDSNFIVGKDISGWGSLIISGEIGIFITILVVIYSNNQQKKINGIIESIDKILLEQKQSNDQRKNFALIRLRTFLANLRGEVSIIDNLINRLNTEPESETAIVKEITMNYEAKGILIKSLEDTISLSIGAVNSEFLDSARYICELASNRGFGRVGNELWEHGMNKVVIFSAIDKLLAALPEPSL